jgi:hypothetical protein
MPRIAIDYSKTLMYKLVCNDLDVPYTYVGHSTSFKDRKKSHKSNCNNEIGKFYNYKVYQTIRENGGWENWTMIEIEKYPCKDIYEATKRERELYEELNADLNMRNPNRPRKERNDNNKEKRKEFYKKYYEINKEKLKQKVDCECGGKYTKIHLSRHIKSIKHQNFINNI